MSFDYDGHCKKCGEKPHPELTHCPTCSENERNSKNEWVEDTPLNRVPSFVSDPKSEKGG